MGRAVEMDRAVSGAGISRNVEEHRDRLADLHQHRGPYVASDLRDLARRHCSRVLALSRRGLG